MCTILTYDSYAPLKMPLSNYESHQKKEVKKVDRNEGVVLISLVGLATLGVLVGGTMLAAYAADNNIGVRSFAGLFNRTELARLRWLRGGGRWGAIEVSEDYEENVINIAKSDPDVLDLLDSDYNVTGVRPIITTIVDADGNVVMKATSAVVRLEKDTTSRAFVWVDLEEGKVTRIAILTVTIIEK